MQGLYLRNLSSKLRLDPNTSCEINRRAMMKPVSRIEELNSVLVAIDADLWLHF